MAKNNQHSWAGGGWRLVRRTIADWTEDKAPQLGAALAFYTALSIAPMLVIVLGVVAFFYGDEAAAGQVARQLRSLVGDEGGKAIEEMIASANRPATGILATAMSVATLLVGASGVFGQLQSALNTIWEVPAKTGRGVWGFVRDRFLSFAMVMGVAFLLLVSLVVTAVIAGASEMVGGLSGAGPWLAHGVNIVASLVLLTLLFGVMFKLLPDVKIAWSDVWLGAAVTSVLFTVGKLAIGLYLGHSSMASSYGVAGSFVVLLVWVYYSAQILFFGAELTQVYANQFGSKIVATGDEQGFTPAV